jgi:diadenylate cyclase
MPPVRWQSAVDFFVLALAIYLLLRWAKQARAVRIVLAILGLHAAALLTRDYDLTITSWVLSAAGFAAIAVLLIVFQPELRYAFMRIDTAIRSGWRKSGSLGPAHRAISAAAFDLAEQRVGALIVLVRGASVAELVQGGARLGAEVSRDLLEAIFQKTSPLHDGAVIVDGSTMTRACAVLPLTQRPGVPAFFGTRHRAAMGLSERSDALVIAVSEQRGTVTLMERGKAHEIYSSDQLAEMLQRLETEPRMSRLTRLRLALTANVRFKLAALAIAAAIWSIVLYVAGTTVRTVNVPVVFNNVPAGMSIASETTFDIDVQLRGNPLIMDSAPLDRVVATLNLSGAKPGTHVLKIRARDFDLPPGVHFERASPPSIFVRLSPAPH